MATNAEVKKALLQVISEDQELRAILEAIPDEVAQTVAGLMPYRTGTAKASIEVKARRTPYKKLSTRKTKIGTVYSDDDPVKIATLEFGRAPTDDNGETPEYAPFRRAAAAWNDR